MFRKLLCVVALVALACSFAAKDCMAQAPSSVELYSTTCQLSQTGNGLNLQWQVDLEYVQMDQWNTVYIDIYGVTEACIDLNPYYSQTSHFNAHYCDDTPWHHVRGWANLP